MNAFKLVFSVKACFKVVVRSVKIREAIVFLIDPYCKSGHIIMYYTHDIQVMFGPFYSNFAKGLAKIPNV